MNSVLLVDQKEIFKEERVAPLPGEGEVIVEVAYCGVCRTDRKSYRLGQRDLHMPRILGHEFSGRVYAVGEHVVGYRIGDRVAVYPGIGCGECDECIDGNDQRCNKMKILGFHLDGGFSRYCRIPAQGVKRGIIRPVPESVSLQIAAMCEPLGCAWHMLQSVDFSKTKTVLICGGGVLGYIMAMLCRYYGVKNILISEPNERKRKICENTGFTALTPKMMVEYVGSVYKNGVDVVIPCCPNSDSFEEALRLLKNGGFFGYFSGLVGNQTIMLSVLNQIHYKELTMVGAYGCGKKDFVAALDLLEEGFDLSSLPINEISLDDVESILCQEETEHFVLTMINYEMEA